MNHTIRQLANNPLIAYAINTRPQRFELAEYDAGMFPALAGNVLGMSVKSAKPLYRLGRVMSFDVVPFRKADPVLVYSPVGNLKPYWKVWASVMRMGIIWLPRLQCIRYDRAIRTFIESAGDLTPHELAFAVVEMLKFKNDVILYGATYKNYWDTQP